METIKLNFVCSYYDTRASINRDLLLTYFIQCQVNSDSQTLTLLDVQQIKLQKKQFYVSLYDRQNKRTYLKKTKVQYEALNLNQLYVGNIISLFSRKLTIDSFADKSTEQFLLQDVTLVKIRLASPVCASLASAIAEFESLDYRLSQVKGNMQNLIVIMTGYCGKENETLAKVQAKFSKISIERFFQTKQNGKITTIDNNYAENFDENVSVSCLTLLPHVIVKGEVGELLKQLFENFTQRGLTINYIKSQVFNIDESKAIFEIYKGVWLDGFYHEKSCHLSSGISISCAIATENESCVEILRNICGPNDINVAKTLRPQSLRAKFGLNSIKSAVHCTDLATDGLSDVQLVFSILQK